MLGLSYRDNGCWMIKYFIWILTPLSIISWWRKPDKLISISKMRGLDKHYLILYLEEFENTKEQTTAIKVQSMSPIGTTQRLLQV